MHEFTCPLATLELPTPELQQLLAAVHGNQKALNDFARMNAGTISPAEVFAQKRQCDDGRCRWHGEADTLMPITPARGFAKLIPGCETHFIQDAGHLLLESEEAGSQIVARLLSV